MNRRPRLLLDNEGNGEPYTESFVEGALRLGLILPDAASPRDPTVAEAE